MTVERKLYVRARVTGMAVAALCALSGFAATASARDSRLMLGSASSDSLYVGDFAAGAVNRFDPLTAAFVNSFATPGPFGPTGLVRYNHMLVVANQHALQANTPGEIDRYTLQGSPLPPLIPPSSNAPPAPRGIIVASVTHGGHRKHVLFVASPACDPNDTAGTTPGILQEFDADTGTLISEYGSPCGTSPSSFHPRGLVLGPDGKLYVSNDPTGPQQRDASTGVGGQVLRFDPQQLSKGPIDKAPFIDDQATCRRCDFNRPEGLVFAPDRRHLYVTSFKNTSQPTASSDKIWIFDTKSRRARHIDFFDSGADTPRTYAQALLFGPHGRLYVPITSTGAMRVYNVQNLTFTEASPANTHLIAPFYLMFGRTNPATLAYGDD